MADDLIRGDDKSLLALAAGGSHAAFKILVFRHVERCYAVAYRVLGDRGLAEDTVQEVFAMLWMRPGGWDETRGVKFQTWLHRVVVNRAIDASRQRSRRPASEDLLAFDFVDAAPLAEEILETKQDTAWLRAAVMRLPERQRLAMVLCFYEGLSQAEAADVLRISVKGVESLVVRAKQRLRQDLRLQLGSAYQSHEEEA